MNIMRHNHNHISKRVFFAFFGCLICFVGVTLNIIWRVLVASLHYAQPKTSHVATILRLLSCRISDDLNQTFEDMINMSVWRTHPVVSFTFDDVLTLQMVFYEKKYIDFEISFTKKLSSWPYVLFPFSQCLVYFMLFNIMNFWFWFRLCLCHSGTFSRSSWCWWLWLWSWR